MAQLYRHKWEASEGQILDEKQNYTDGFLLWCRKTEGLSDEQWKRGFEVLEEELRIAERTGEKLWPPSYVAFIEKCESIQNRKMYKPFPRQLQLEDETAKEKRIERGKQEISSLLGLWK